ALPQALKPIYAVAMTADGQLAACSRANAISIYQLTAGRLAASLTDPELTKTGLYPPPGPAHLDAVQSLAFHPAGDLLASGAFREVKLWRRSAEAVPLATPAGAAPGDDASALATSADGKWAAAGTAKGAVELWDLAAGKA